MDLRISKKKHEKWKKIKEKQKNCNKRNLWNNVIINRTELSTAIRKGPISANILQAGFDEKTGPCLYYFDYLGSMAKLDKAAHGYCAFFLSRFVAYFCFVLF